MNRTFSKSTEIEIIEMRDLYKEGWTIKGIGEKLKKDRTSVLYWLKKSDEYVKGRKWKMAPDRFKIKKPRGGLRLRAKDVIPIGNCCYCRNKIEDPKWKMTHYCCSNCWTGRILNVRGWGKEVLLAENRKET